MRRLWIGSLSLLVLGALGGTAAAVPITVPPGLNPGDPYRLAFVTSTTRNATSSNVADYDAFVTAAANAVPVLAALGTTWTAIQSTCITFDVAGTCTLSADARDNTGTNPTIEIGVPIFRLDGTLLANNNADLWDGAIAVPLNLDENGVLVGRAVWAGDGPTPPADGVAGPGGGLGDSGIPGDTAGAGSTAFADGRWMSSFPIEITFETSLYAMSATLIVPEPGSGVLLSLGLVAMAFARRRTV